MTMIKHKKKTAEAVKFDSYAEDYDAIQKESMGALGKDLTVFAKYKINYIKKLTHKNPLNILEFGCGTGRNLPYLKEVFPTSKITACDISEQSLKCAKKIVPDINYFISANLSSLHDYEKQFDLIFMSGVIHHIPLYEREQWLSALSYSLKNDGDFFIFEHNPFNPLTRWLVNNCAFDKGVKLLWPAKGKALLKHAGLCDITVDYTLLFPWRKPLLEALEHSLSFLPLGGQYCLHAKK